MATAGDGEADERVRIITGDELGFLKGGEGDKASGVVRLAATPLTSQEHLLVVGRASGALDVLSTVDGALVATAALPGVGGGSDVTITGVGFVPSPGGPSSIIACTSDGHVITFKVEGAALEEASRWQVPLPVNPKKGSLDCLAVSPNGQEIATGGEGTELAMYNLETHEATFKVKPPKPDRLGMVPRPWISAVSYFPGEGSRKVICGTGSNLGKGRVLVYDAAVQRRALTTIEYGETKITSVAADAGGLHGYAATGAGDLSRFDLRAAKAEGAFKGPAGSVRALALHPSMPLIASAGLDRFARVHTTGTRKAVGKVYAKIPMTGVVFAAPPEVVVAGGEGAGAGAGGVEGAGEGAGEAAAAVAGGGGRCGGGWRGGGGEGWEAPSLLRRRPGRQKEEGLQVDRNSKKKKKKGSK